MNGVKEMENIFFSSIKVMCIWFGFILIFIIFRIDFDFGDNFFIFFKCIYYIYFSNIEV